MVCDEGDVCGWWVIGGCGIWSVSRCQCSLSLESKTAEAGAHCKDFAVIRLNVMFWNISSRVVRRVDELFVSCGTETPGHRDEFGRVRNEVTSKPSPLLARKKSNSRAAPTAVFITVVATFIWEIRAWLIVPASSWPKACITAWYAYLWMMVLLYIESAPSWVCEKFDGTSGM